MTNQTNGSDKQKRKAFSGEPGSGTAYHEEHAGNVTGYGEPNSTVTGMTNTTNNDK